MFRKRIRELGKGEITTPANAFPDNLVVSVRSDFVSNLFEVRESYLSFIRVKMLGNEVCALLDTGSSRTFLGPVAIELVQSLKCWFCQAKDCRVTTATSQMTRVKERSRCPSKWKVADVL